MAYATADMMRAHRPERELVQLTDPELTAVDDTRLQTALSAASAEIDGYLGGRYPVPMDPAPQVLGIIAMDLAYYRLHQAVSPSVAEAVRKQYEDWTAFLRRVADGRADLVPPTTPDAAPVASPADVLVSGPDAVYSRPALGGF